MSDWLADRKLPDGRWLTVIPLTFGRARLTVGPHPVKGYYDDGW